MVQSPAHATATASATISDVTCTQVTNTAGTLVSTPSFASEFSFVGPIGQINEGLTGLQPTAATCFASHLAQGESLTMSAHVTLTVQDQGLLGAGGGHIQFPFPYWDAFIPNPVPVPSGFEFAYAAADISNHPGPRDSSH